MSANQEVFQQINSITQKVLSRQSIPQGLDQEDATQQIAIIFLENVGPSMSDEELLEKILGRFVGWLAEQQEAQEDTYGILAYNRMMKNAHDNELEQLSEREFHNSMQEFLTFIESRYKAFRGRSVDIFNLFLVETQDELTAMRKQVCEKHHISKERRRQLEMHMSRLLRYYIHLQRGDYDDLGQSMFNHHLYTKDLEIFKEYCEAIGFVKSNQE